MFNNKSKNNVWLPKLCLLALLACFAVSGPRAGFIDYLSTVGVLIEGIFKNMGFLKTWNQNRPESIFLMKISAIDAEKHEESKNNIKNIYKKRNERCQEKKQTCFLYILCFAFLKCFELFTGGVFFSHTPAVQSQHGLPKAAPSPPASTCPWRSGPAEGSVATAARPPRLHRGNKHAYTNRKKRLQCGF